LTKNCISQDPAQKALGTDELDIIEAYGGQGWGNPNFPGYAVTSHYWGEKDANGVQIKDDHTDVPIMDLGGKSTWSTTFHTYAIKITKTESTYYFDDIPVLTYPTKPLSASQPFWFLINYAIAFIKATKQAGAQGYVAKIPRFRAGNDARPCTLGGYRAVFRRGFRAG
jgi:hypothetical protein